ncbi:MAG: transposase, partial [Rikenellaceae bacterium]|nr:transposase [Rikenellaceae bacterium]
MERRENEMLKGHKYIYLKAYRNLTTDKKAQLNMLTLMYPQIGESCRLKVMFNEFWQIKDMQETQG